MAANFEAASQPAAPSTSITEEATKPAFKNVPRTVHLLVASLRIDSQRMNMQAVADLIAIGEPAVPYLIKALGDNHAQVWRLASAGLVKIGAPAVQPLVDALEHEDEQTRLLAAGTLHKMNALQQGDPGWRAMIYEYARLVHWQRAAQRQSAGQA